MNNAKKLLVIDLLSKSYNKIPVLEKFSLTTLNGEIIGIAGANGSGKSTLLKLFNTGVRHHHYTHLLRVWKI